MVNSTEYYNITKGMANLLPIEKGMPRSDDLLQLLDQSLRITMSISEFIDGLKHRRSLMGGRDRYRLHNISTYINIIDGLIKDGLYLFDKRWLNRRSTMIRHVHSTLYDVHVTLRELKGDELRYHCDLLSTTIDIIFTYDVVEH